MIRTLRNPLLLAGLAALSSGCAVVRTVVKAPEFQVQNFQLTSYTLPSLLRPFDGEARFQLDVRINNPNPFGLQVQRIQGDFLLDGQRFGQAVVPGLQLPASGSTVVTTEIQIPITLNLASKIADLSSGRPVDYLVKSMVQVDAGLLGTATFDNIVVAQGRVNR